MLKKLVMFGLVVSFLAASSLAFAEDVFVTKRGKKFHSEICRVIKDKNVTKIDRAQAEEKGLTPCSRCLAVHAQDEHDE